MRYVELKDKPIDPNRAKWYALLLCAVAALIALMTLKSNFDYFSQYYEGFGFWMRVIPFSAVEVTIIALPLTKGWGNHSQQIAALICEVVLIGLSITHTSFVSQASQAKIQAGKTKAEAQADFDRAQTQADKIAKQNADLQDSYNRAMVQWNRAAYNARRNRQQPPPAPAAPQLMAVPQIDQKIVDNSMISTEQASEAEVSHALLLRLLYAMIAGVIASAASVVWFADASRVKSWLLQRKAEKIKEATTGARVVETDALYDSQFPALSSDVVAQEPRRVIGFGSQTRDKDIKTEQHSLSLSEVHALRQRLRHLSSENPGMSFKVDRGGRFVFVRAMKSERGSQATASTLKLSEAEARQLIGIPEGDCKRDLAMRFQSQNLHLNF